MTPTNKLRFVKRTIYIPHEGSINICELRKFEILQQWWQGEYTGEWRDVPVEEEQSEGEKND
jgi:hypothetical protein